MDFDGGIAEPRGLQQIAVAAGRPGVGDRVGACMNDGADQGLVVGVDNEGISALSNEDDLPARGEHAIGFNERPTGIGEFAEDFVRAVYGDRCVRDRKAVSGSRRRSWSIRMVSGWCSTTGSRCGCLSPVFGLTVAQGNRRRKMSPDGGSLGEAGPVASRYAEGRYRIVGTRCAYRPTRR